MRPDAELEEIVRMQDKFHKLVKVKLYNEESSMGPLVVKCFYIVPTHINIMQT